MAAVSFDGAPLDDSSLASVADIRRILESLVSERQQLRARMAERPALEANRLAIVYWQLRLANRLSPTEH